MKRKPVILDPICSKCQRVMVWQTMRLVGAVPVNVYRCDACDRLSATAHHRQPPLTVVAQAEQQAQAKLEAKS